MKGKVMTVEAYIALGLQLLGLLLAGVKIHNSITARIDKTDNKIERKHMETMGNINLIKADINHLKENGVSALTRELKECKEYRNRRFDEFGKTLGKHEVEIAKLKGK